MTTIPERCWQIAAGDTNRNYADLCLRHDAIMTGPGYCGHWGGRGCTDRLRSDGWSSRKITNLELFCTSVKPGDLVVMRVGKSEVHGVGFVRSDYDHSDFFADVDGWDLNHFYRVEWVWKKPEGKAAIFPDALNFGDTTQLLIRSKKTEALIRWIEELPSPTGSPVSALPPMPGKNIGERQISEKLFDYGLGSHSISSLEKSIRDLVSLGKWYTAYAVMPSETETVAHLVVPLLTALGWTPQRLALEYYQPRLGRADIALYGNGNRKNYQPIAIIEAKKFEDSCLTAESQVRAYAENLQMVKRLVLTDGIRYGVFVSDGHSQRFPVHPTAYLNLRDLRDDYPIYGDCKGADAAILYLSADWRETFDHPALNRLHIPDSI
jgi:hypothetical protein